MSSQTGLAAVNGDVLSAINDMIGRVILISTTDKKRYSGVLDAVSSDLAFGLQCVVEITKKNENNLLRTESEVVEKMLFNFEDIVDFAYVTQEDTKNHLVSKFVTDRQYHGDAPNDNEELQEWNGGEEEDGLGGSIEDDVVTTGSQSSRRNNHNNGIGWSVNEMFAVNEKMNVVSTFKEDLTQYTTVEVVGSEEDRARAERLAREIESNSSSKFMANLENDDDERDLDKMTRQEDFDNGNNQRGGKRNSYNQPPQQRRNSNITPNGQPVNRRAEGLRGDRRNSGSSSANNSRYGSSAPVQNYQPQGQKTGGSHNNRRQNEEYRDNDWQMAKGKGQNQGHDQSFRQQQKQMLDPRPSAKQSEGEKSQGSGSRVTVLKNWGNEFSIATKEQSPAPGSTPPAPQGNSGSAWNRGPPSSLVAKGTTTDTTPLATENEESSASKTVSQKKEDSPSIIGDGNNETDGHQEDGDNISITDRSETSSVVTTKSTSFKFNINAPEFKPRPAAAATPTPTTPTGSVPQNLPQISQQFIPAASEYQQHPGMLQQVGQQGSPMGLPGGMVPHMPPGGVPQNQGQPIMMWQQGQQGYPQPHQFSAQQAPAPGVPGQMYGPAATNPLTVNQLNQQAQQIPTSNAGNAPTDGRPGNAHVRRQDGEYRETQPLFYPPYGQTGQMMPVQQQFYPQQYQGTMQQQSYPMKLMQQQGPQGNYPQRFQQQQPQPVYMVPQGQIQQPRYQGVAQQPHQFAGEQGAPQSHSNSQPTTPGPRGEMNGQKVQQGPQPQNGNNGMHREPEAGSNASLSGSASSQSGQRSGSPQNTAAPPQQQLQQGPPHGGAQHSAPPHVAPPHVGLSQQPMQVPQQPVQFMVMQHHQMHPQMPNYYPQQSIYYPTMVVPQQMQMQQNQHGQQSLMGERADTGYSQNNIFDYRTMPNYQPNQQHQQHQQMPPPHIPRQNSLPQQFVGNQALKV